jgi:hypothetical protein
MDRKPNSFNPLALLLTVLAALLRLVPHPPNFSPIGAAALFGGARLRSWQAYVVPLVAMVLTDPIRSRMEGGYPAYSAMTPIIYGSFLISVFLGQTFLRDTNRPIRIASVAFAGSLQFFLITNFVVWLDGRDLYPQTFAGLSACYVAALPFFGRTVLADLVYCGLLFGVYALVTRRLILPIHTAKPQSD